jgi:hypothetical protein
MELLRFERADSYVFGRNDPHSLKRGVPFKIEVACVSGDAEMLLKSLQQNGHFDWDRRERAPPGP